jgi:hypothetical protein
MSTQGDWIRMRNAAATAARLFKQGCCLCKGAAAVLLTVPMDHAHFDCVVPLCADCRESERRIRKFLQPNGDPSDSDSWTWQTREEWEAAAQ